MIKRIASACTLALLLLVIAAMASCGGSGNSRKRPAAPVVTVDADIKQLIFTWEEVSRATHYILLENPDGMSGFTQTGDDIPAGILSVRMPIAVHLHDFERALYIVQACNDVGCNNSGEVNAVGFMLDTIGYIKSSAPQGFDQFGAAISLSADGNTMAVGSHSSGVGDDSNDDNVGPRSGTVFLFRFDGTVWVPQGFVKASNAEHGDGFGKILALSSDGYTLAVGATSEKSTATGINGDETDNSASCCSGAVYVFRFDGTVWFQQAYVKASNTEEFDQFGSAIALSADGDMLVVGAPNESSSARGVNGDQANNFADVSGAVYVFRFNGTDWFQQAYIKASNTGHADWFGSAVALSEEGNLLAVGAVGEYSNATGIGGNQADNSAPQTGAVYLFSFDGTDWTQKAYIKASNTDSVVWFGWAVSLSADGNTLVVGAPHETSNATGINGDQSDNSAYMAGAVYVFRFNGADWFQQAYVKGSNTEGGVISRGDEFGWSVALDADGDTLVVGAPGEESRATGVNGEQFDNSVDQSGAVYVYRFDGIDWAQRTYVKASNTGLRNRFGAAAALSAESNMLVVGAPNEGGNSIGAAYTY